MKKILCFTLILSLILCMNIWVLADDTIADITENEIYYIDVGLFYGSSAKASVVISTDEGTFTVNAADVFDTVQYDSDGLISVDGKKYRGSIILKKDSKGLLTVINHVDIEDYIASVVAVEMSSSFELEALKAQAVCARTYALRFMDKHSSYGFDMCAGTDCQVYKGVSVETEKTSLAAKQTKGMVMKYDGKLIEAVYSATSGGWTEDVKYVWGSNIPYLQAAEDAYESKDVYGSSWEKEITVEKATEIMNDKDYDLGTITNIEVTESTEHGTATKLVVSGTNGEKTFTKEGCRLAFSSITLSQAFTVKPTSDTKEAEPVYAYGGTKVSGNVTVLSSKGTSKLSLDNVTLQGNTARIYAGKITGPVTGFLFNGRGYGHLVGLSQNGANGMAKAGFAFDEILKHYYKGIEIDWI